jgi:chromosome segregation ATPase
MSSLTREQSSHMAALDILRQARHDKDELEDKFLAVEKDCADKTALIGELQADLESEREAHAFWKTKFSGADGQLEEEKGENAALTEIIDQRDESIDELSNANSDKQAEIEVLQRSLQAKDKQLLSVCRDRDRLKDQLEAAQKALKPVQRRRAAQVTSSSSSSKVLRDRSVNMDVSSRPSVGNHSGAYGKRGDKGRGQTAAGKGTRKLQAQAHADEEGGLDMDLSLDDGPFSVRERMLRGVIRRLRQELAAQKPCTF